MPARSAHLVVIGASTGGVSALLEISERLPRGFPAPVCIVQHVGSNPSLLPELMRLRGADAVHARDRQPLVPGTLYVAPPDHHLLVAADHVRLTRGPKENHVRPAVDPLFRTAALAWGPRTIGVVLTGALDDGTAGLRAIKECGGVAVVQDPHTAVEPGMPASALRHVAVDHCVALDAIPGLLQRLVAQPAPAAARPPERLVREVAIYSGDHSMENLEAIADRSPLTCPDCGGGLFEVRGEQPPRYRCHTGHAFTAASLAHVQAEQGEETLRNGVRVLREREMLLRRLANIARATGDEAQAAAGHAQADRLRQQIQELVDMVESEGIQPPSVHTA